ncbi:metal ABC transporter solute-binding protein, Zn/Mn family [uncultured Vibrio sp.]|uniref:zinc ABC transporter substrate-binding protein n=1 Tax=uncultured Vibrio sp. TaxID=114054 RepID=UPI002AA6CEDC|nr:zinc ABC transporter substrate-binding protein [uncultured Vibrio sp.]
MLKQALSGIVIALATASQAYAQVPKVAVDIAPLHSLVTQVMDGVGEPDLLIRPEASPHDYHLRPSEANALSQANIVFWIGEGLTPWLEKPLSSLASSATKIEMMEVEGTTLYGFREGATFEAHVHSEEGHEEHEEHQEHQEHDDHHHHGDHDPHVWLDPKNAEVWVEAIASALSNVDTEHAHIYEDNAKATIIRLHQLSGAINEQAQSLNGIKFIVFHDAYQYFEQRFQLLASGAISISDASKPSPARISKIRQTVKDLGVTCVFTEPQFNPELVNTVFENSTVKTIGTMDPIGANIAPGKDQYHSLLMAMINSLKQCHH